MECNEQFEDWWENRWGLNLPNGTQYIKDIAKEAWDEAIASMKVKVHDEATNKEPFDPDYTGAYGAGR